MVESTFVKLLENWYRFTGIWTNKNNRKFNWILILLSFISLAYNIISSIYLGYLNIQDMELFSEIMLHFLYSIFVAYVWYTVLVNRKHLTNIYNYVECKSDIYCNTASHVRIKQTIEKAEKYIITVVNLFLYTFLTTVFIRGVPTLLLHRKRKLIFPLWLPFNTDSNLYYLAFFYEIIVYIHFISIIYGLSILYFGFTTFYPTLLSIIGETFNSTEKLTENKNWHLDQNHQQNFLKLMEDVLRRAIKEHDGLNKSLQDLKPILGRVFLGISILTEICLCFIVFSAVQKKTLFALLESLLLSLCFLLIVYVCCWCGNKFQDMNDVFSEVVYGCPWYHLPVCHQMSVLMVLKYVTKPVNFSSVTLAEPTLSAFVLVLQTAYSYLNLLLALSRNQDRQE